MKLIITFLIAILFTSCKQNEQNNEIVQDKIPKTEAEVELTAVCKNGGFWA
jgi:hypothetical protein